MTKQATPRKKIGFWGGFAIWVSVFLVLIAVGLVWFWHFIEAYELSRPQTAINEYLQTVTAERICGLDTKTLGGCDTAIQSRDTAKQIIADSLDTFTCAKNSRLSTEEEMVYMVMSAGKNIGRVTITKGEKDDYGFEHWTVAGEEFDFSYLLGETVSITVPADYQVFADGVLLGEAYVTESDIRFAHLEDYYGQYDAPTLCSYTAGPILGTPVLTVQDNWGEPVTVEEDTDLTALYNNCTAEEKTKLESFCQDYLKAYVDYASGNGGKEARFLNLGKLRPYLVTGGNLAQRMENSLDTMYWTKDRNTVITHIEHHQFLLLEEKVYLCDLTYSLTQNGEEGVEESTVNLRLVILSTGSGLKVEAMTVY